MDMVRTVEDVVDVPLGSVGMALDAMVHTLIDQGWTVQRKDPYSMALTCGARSIAVALAAAGRGTVVRLTCEVAAGPLAGVRRRLQCRLALARLRSRARQIHRSGPPDGPPAPSGRGLRDEFRSRGYAVIDIPSDEDQ